MVSSPDGALLAGLVYPGQSVVLFYYEQGGMERKAMSKFMRARHEKHPPNLSTWLEWLPDQQAAADGVTAGKLPA